jgi:hypothetical protein
VIEGTESHIIIRLRGKSGTVGTVEFSVGMLLALHGHMLAMVESVGESPSVALALRNGTLQRESDGFGHS